MEEKSLQLAFASPVLAAVIKDIGCDNEDRCVDKTISLLSKLSEKLS